MEKRWRGCWGGGSGIECLWGKDGAREEAV